MFSDKFFKLVLYICATICLVDALSLSEKNVDPAAVVEVSDNNPEESIHSSHSDNTDENLNIQTRCIQIGQNDCDKSSECCGYPTIVCAINLNTWVTTCVPRFLLKNSVGGQEMQIID
uniref:uncharacterized protein LOC120328225 isoform X1 n=1 Tax=Styela clava TaxID=7725 RepID=UPI00193953E2|nr:uncharacterized protein LOC120328225 isoform X1 [Styela clava]XP_039250590.1 uncharacterized protein LOC120328225 isoform X2 [Styela clava]